MDISLVIPLYNEAESLPELEAWIARVMKENGFSYEIWFVNDIETVRHQKINKFCHDKQNQNSRIRYPQVHKLYYNF